MLTKKRSFGSNVPEQKSVPPMPRLVSMGELRLRPCEVDGFPAWFHRWVEQDRVLLNVGAFCKPEDAAAINRRFRASGVIPGGGSIDVVRETFALVEYPDGVVATVKPELVRFVNE